MVKIRLPKTTVSVMLGPDNNTYANIKDLMVMLMDFKIEREKIKSAEAIEVLNGIYTILKDFDKQMTKRTSSDE